MSKSKSWLHRPVSIPSAIAIFTVVLGLSWLALTRFKPQQVGINEVRVSDQFYTTNTCNKNDLDSLTFTQPCSPHGFYAVSYRCTGSNDAQNTVSRICQTTSKLQALAEQACPDVCPKPSYSPRPSTTNSKCMPRPACLDAKPACMIMIPEGVSYCPASPNPVQ